MKRCPTCGKTKPTDDFPRNRRSKDGFATYCKPCHNARGRAAIERAGGTRGYHLWRRYGITLEDVVELQSIQGGVCAVCGTPDPDHVDHDHESGRIRGLLCFNCNGGLGQFKDDAVNLRRAADYLDRAAAEPLPLVVPARHDRRRRQAPTLPFDGDVAE